MRLFVPIILVVAAIGLFVVYTNPEYQQTKALSAQVAAYDDALNKSQELRAVRDQLLSKRNTFSSDDVQKLSEVLPDNVDNIRLIIDINNIASRHGLSLSGVNIGDISGSANKNVLSSGTGAGPTGNVDVSFAITTSYDGMLSFLSDLEHSLRLVDVEKISFTAGNTSTYTFDIRTYWLH